MSEQQTDGWGLTEEERLAISGVVHQNYYMPDVFTVVGQIIADRLPDSETTTEWNVEGLSGLTWGRFGTTEGSARITHARSTPPRTLVSRERTRYADRVTEWAPVDVSSRTNQDPA